MKITLKRTNDSMRFEAQTEKGYTTNLSGDGDATSPMEAVLNAVAGCSTIDIVMILQKMRQTIDDIHVEVEAKRRDEDPRTFTAIHLHYILKGDIKEKKIEEAIDLSVNKYCSVALMLREDIKITTSYVILIHNAA